MKMREVPVPTDRDARRFWSRVDTSAGPDGCWPWMGYREPRGYGQFAMTRDGETRVYYAHRVAFVLAHGAISPRHVVRHECDHPWCCNNVRCLVAGTSQDNTRDMIERGRAGRPNAVMTPEVVAQLRRLYATGRFSYTALAEWAGVTSQTVAAAVRGDTWRDVAEPPVTGSPNQLKHARGWRP